MTTVLGMLSYIGIILMYTCAEQCNTVGWGFKFLLGTFSRIIPQRQLF